MDYIYCGVNFPAPRFFERIRVDNVNFNENSGALKERIFNEIIANTKDDECEISLMYLGNILMDDEPISKQPNIRSGSTIHVLKKAKEDDTKRYSKFTEVEVSKYTSLYRSLNSGHFHKISRPEVIKAIFNKHPELEKDIAILSFLKDPILLATLQNPDVIRKMGENHRILIEASETICKALKSIKSTSSSTAAPPPSIDHDFSDSASSSGSETNSPQASTSAGNARGRITSDYLRQSLAAAQTNRNSLASISDRLSQRQLGQGISPSGSSSSVPSRRNFISNSMFMNAMNEVLLAARSEAGVSQSATPQEEQMPEVPPPAAEERAESQESEEMQTDDDEQARAARDQADVEMIAGFQDQLRQMEEMGLRNKAQNIQALMVCSGNLEAAVNLVLAEMNSLF